MKIIKSFATLLGLGKIPSFVSTTDHESSTVSVEINFVAIEHFVETPLLQATVGSIKCFDDAGIVIEEALNLVLDPNGVITFDIDPITSQFWCVLEGIEQTNGNILYMPSIVELYPVETDSSIAATAYLYPDRVARGDQGKLDYGQNHETQHTYANLTYFPFPPLQEHSAVVALRFCHSRSGNWVKQ